MCVLIVRPPGKYVHRRHLKEAFRCNDDGAGFMFDVPAERSGTGKDAVRIFKGWFGFRQFYKDLRACERAYPDSTFVIHMRIGTSGTKTADNCHPFRISDHAGFAHNGVMYGLGDKVRSDTREFVEDTLCHLPDRFWENPDIVAALSQCAINSTSKYVLLFGDGSYLICNESMGHWLDGCWYSNYSYVLPVTTCTSNEVASSLHTVAPKPPLGELKRPTLILPMDSPVKTDEEVEHQCTMCGCTLSQANTGFTRWSLKLCNRCLDSMYYVVHVRCDACLMSNVLTPDLLFGRNDMCEFCHGTVSTDDVVWQLIAASSLY